MISCTKRIEFDAAHRIMNHGGMCKMLHGHRYGVEATFSIASINGVGESEGMVLDFAIIKERLGKWINTNWDHNTILDSRDKALGNFIEACTKQTIFYLDMPPTAENLAVFLLKIAREELFWDIGVECTKIRVYETPTSYAEAFI